MSNFDGHLDPQYYLNWVMSLERYFKWYEMSQARRIALLPWNWLDRLGTIGQMLRVNGHQKVRICSNVRRNKNYMNQKYFPIVFQNQQLDKWSRLNQGNRSVADYIETFDEFLTRCSGFVDESPTVTLSRFRSGLCENLRRKLFARGVCDLEHAYQIVRDLYISRGSYF